MPSAKKMKRRRLLRAGIVTGSLLMVGSVGAMIYAGLGLRRTMRGVEGSVISNPQTLAMDIDAALYGTFLGLVLFGAGLTLLVGCSIRDSKRPPPLPPERL
jgi:Mn2+/Fe2+ NRAMP family transporter